MATTMEKEAAKASVDLEKPDADHLETPKNETPKSAQDAQAWADIKRDAKQANRKEHALTLKEALRTYPKAVGWSVFVSLACVMEGYGEVPSPKPDVSLLNSPKDTAFITSLYAQNAFRRDFGVPYDGGYEITAPWQTGLSMGAKVGIIIGIFLNGYLAEKFGMKRLMLVCYVLICAFTFILVFAKSMTVLLIGEILCGLPWGIFNTTAPAYASEVCPLALRGYLTTFINLTWVVGQLISAGVLRGVSDMTSTWAWRIPFALQWVWPVPLFIGMLFCPESPWWLLRQDRLEDAERSLKRLSVEADTKQTIAMMIHTNELEKKTKSGSYADCFRGVDLRRTEIAACTWAIQQLSGLPLVSFLPFHILVRVY